jgi:hypothetical protein
LDRIVLIGEASLHRATSQFLLHYHGVGYDVIEAFANRFRTLEIVMSIQQLMALLQLVGLQ